MKAKVKKIIALLGFIAILLNSFCGKSPMSTESPLEKQYAKLQITILREPVILIFDWPTYNTTGEYSWKGNINVIISETGGVGCNIKSVDLKFIYQNSLHEPSSFEGGKLNPFGKLEIPLELSVEYGEYEKIRVTTTGTDDNGHSISASKDFTIENLPGLGGVYRGKMTGTQLGWLPFSSILTLNIKQENKRISGNWSTDKGTSGTFKGEFEAEGELTWRFGLDATQYNPDYGLYKSTGKIKNWGYYIIGSFKGESGEFGKIDASFSLTRSD